MVWQLTTKLSLHDRDGRITGLVGIGRDITQRKQAEEEIKRQLSEKEILLREVHHRIKNNVAVIESLLSMQADSAEAAVALRQAISRVQSTRILYEKLLLNNDYKVVSMKRYIEDLVDSLVAVFQGGNDITIEKRVADFALDSEQAIPIGIITNELLTNIFKYAFHGRDEGRISIDRNRSGTRVTLTIRDNGVGIRETVAANESPGFGLTIVKMLVAQLSGTLGMENDNGTRCTVEFGAQSSTRA